VIPYLTVFALTFATSAEKKVHSYLTVRDYQSASETARDALKQSPENQKLWEAYLQALAKCGEESQMMKAWGKYTDLFPQELHNRHLLECMAWGIIEKGSFANSPLVRAYALLGAFLGQDALGVEIIQRNLSDPNNFIRTLALRLSSDLHDVRLKDEVFRLFKKEKMWSVRLEVIRAVGKMKIKELINDLIQIVINPSTSAEEKAAATEALVNLFEKPTKEELFKLSQSPRAALRQIACEIILHSGGVEDAEIVFPLIQDSCADIRAAALQTLGILKVTTVKGKSVIEAAFHLQRDPNPVVAIMAAWYLTITQTQLYANPFSQWLVHPKQEIRLFAGTALATTGKYGIEWLKSAFYHTEDPYLKMNLAFGMLSQRNNIEEAAVAIYQTFVNNRERWMWEEKGIFRILSRSKIKHSELIPNNPEVVNQLTRLDILNILSKIDTPHVQQAILSFLQEKSWGVSGVASALLLTEGDELALQYVEELLYHSNHKIRIQASLILALWGKGEAAIQVLQQAYNQAKDHELKHQILEGLGSIGSSYSIPFLTECLNDFHQTTRIIAASALLQCLYH
jgi:HEAT repeat protein